MTNTQIIITVLLMMLATVLTRALPFLIFRGNKPTPKFVVYLGKTLPFASVSLLVVYCYKNISFGAVSGFLPMLIAGAVTAALHFWKSNTLLSIGVGTVLYMVLIQFVFK